ncbi:MULTISPECIES: CheF family chemotaxis protein [unclassified Halorhabdus]|uniref:CheF family chemotaxis protein n=1 Tax=unclassified Halorhabdus TaxID=2621901 RepID=UPI0023DBEF90|nr:MULTISPECIES: CheF family chemotaxis protein [unclassified Halorhabdus]WEL16866.1 Chemotaxis protein CheF [Halorhabdus sp. SVX81]WEL20740.1 Chemotaxis protein CheF [Halorhabdus sp. BNX81]
MSEGERKLADSRGKFVQVVENGRKLNDVEWIPGRILLSNKRLVLASNDGKKTIPIAEIRSVKTRQNVNKAIANVSGYVSVQTGGDVFLLSPADEESFASAIYSARLDQQVVLAKHPAVKGGVVQDTSWEKARIKVSEASVELAISSGQFVEIDLDDVGTIEETERTVLEKQRNVLEVEHAIDGTSVKTYLSGSPSDCSILASLLRSGDQHVDSDIELTDDEREVLMALYSGVSPFEIPDFVGLDVEDVEAIFEQLAEHGVVKKTRTRREVGLKPRGRSIASDVIADQ